MSVNMLEKLNFLSQSFHMYSQRKSLSNCQFCFGLPFCKCLGLQHELQLPLESPLCTLLYLHLPITRFLPIAFTYFFTQNVTKQTHEQTNENICIHKMSVLNYYFPSSCSQASNILSVCLLSCSSNILFSLLQSSLHSTSVKLL